MADNEHIQAMCMLAESVTSVMSGTLYGLYRGVCLSNKDAASRGRIKTYIPIVHGDKVPDPDTLRWTVPCASLGGNQTGSFTPPNEGDPIWVMFEGGDTQYPVWMGFSIREVDNKSDLPSKAYGSDNTPEQDIMYAKGDTAIVAHRDVEGSSPVMVQSGKSSFMGAEEIPPREGDNDEPVSGQFVFEMGDYKGRPIRVWVNREGVYASSGGNTIRIASQEDRISLTNIAGSQIEVRSYPKTEHRRRYDEIELRDPTTRNHITIRRRPATVTEREDDEILIGHSAGGKIWLHEFFTQSEHMDDNGIIYHIDHPKTRINLIADEVNIVATGVIQLNSDQGGDPILNHDGMFTLGRPVDEVPDNSPYATVEEEGSLESSRSIDESHPADEPTLDPW